MLACRGWWRLHPLFSWNLCVPSLYRCRPSCYLRKNCFINPFVIFPVIFHPPACTLYPWYSFLRGQFYVLLFLVWIFSCEGLLGSSAVSLFYSASYLYIPFCCVIASLKYCVSSLTHISLSPWCHRFLFPGWVYIRNGSGYDWWKQTSVSTSGKFIGSHSPAAGGAELELGLGPQCRQQPLLPLRRHCINPLPSHGKTGPRRPSFKPFTMGDKTLSL